MDQYLHNTFLLSLSIQSSFYYKSNSPNHTHIHTLHLYIPKHFYLRADGCTGCKLKFSSMPEDASTHGQEEPGIDALIF